MPRSMHESPETQHDAVYPTVVTAIPPTVLQLQGVNPHEGLPKLRANWVAARDAAGDTCQTQMYYARQGVITPEMAFVAAREAMDPEFVRSEVTQGIFSFLLVFPPKAWCLWSLQTRNAVKRLGNLPMQSCCHQCSPSCVMQ